LPGGFDDFLVDKAFKSVEYAMTRVKICGLMTAEDIRLCVKAGADAVGFVTEYPIPVPWNIDRTRARELVALTPPFVTKTAVVGGPPESILQIADTVKPDLLQLHGDETRKEIEHICSALENTGIQVIKALRIDIDTGKAHFSIEDPLEAAKVLAGTAIAGLVVDSKTAHRPAGTGVPLDWSIIERIASSISIPLILAGGLTVHNVSEAIERVRPYGVDVISGVEKAPGVKDNKRVRQFVRAVKQIRI
jgi:phosphoribosylanthranilate isomerase